MEQIKYKAVIQLTKEQAIELAKNEAWKDMSFRQRAEFQMLQRLLCMPFNVFHEAIEKTLDRPVYTHEFGSMGRKGLMAELFEGKEPPTLQEIIEMIPAEKRIIIYNHWAGKGREMDKKTKNKSEFRWEVDKVRGSHIGFIPELQPGWEPFAITEHDEHESAVYFIWLRRKVLAR